PFFSHLGFEAKAQDKLLDQAVRGEFRFNLRRYQYIKDPKAKGLEAISLLDALRESAKPLKRDFQRIVKEEGFTVLRLQVDLACAERVEKGALQKGLSSDAIYKGVARYLKVAKRSSTLWKKIQ